jgi:hypothetical protein
VKGWCLYYAYLKLLSNCSVLFIVFKTLNLKQSEFLRSFLPWIILGLWMGIGGHLRKCMLQRDMLYACHLIPVRCRHVCTNPCIIFLFFFEISILFLLILRDSRNFGVARNTRAAGQDTSIHVSWKIIFWLPRAVCNLLRACQTFGNRL